VLCGKLVLGTYVATPQQAKVDFESKLPANHPALKRWDPFIREMQSLTSTALRPEFRPEATAQRTVTAG